jgi:hypothetical protein
VEQLAPYHADIEGLVVESTYNWYWLVGLDHGVGHPMPFASTPWLAEVG